jgi:hypothetical protein
MTPAEALAAVARPARRRASRPRPAPHPGGRPCKTHGGATSPGPPAPPYRPAAWARPRGVPPRHGWSPPTKDPSPGAGRRSRRRHERRRVLRSTVMDSCPSSAFWVRAPTAPCSVSVCSTRPTSSTRWAGQDVRRRPGPDAGQWLRRRRTRATASTAGTRPARPPRPASPWTPASRPPTWSASLHDVLGGSSRLETGRRLTGVQRLAGEAGGAPPAGRVAARGRPVRARLRAEVDIEHPLAAISGESLGAPAPTSWPACWSASATLWCRRRPAACGPAASVPDEPDGRPGHQGGHAARHPPLPGPAASQPRAQARSRRAARLAACGGSLWWSSPPGRRWGRSGTTSSGRPPSSRQRSSGRQTDLPGRSGTCWRPEPT